MGYKAMPVTDRSVLLQERAKTSNLTALHIRTSTGSDPKGFADSLTWSQVYSRACIIAEELKLCGLPGDRAVLAPQGLEYVLAFPGRSGWIHRGSAIQLHSMAFTMTAFAVLQGFKPVAILTTSSVVGDVTKKCAASRRAALPRS